MTYNLFIDDERYPFDVTWCSLKDQSLYQNGEWFIARNWFDVLEIVASLGFPRMISFDHDLGDNELTGYEIAKKLVDMVMDGVQIPSDFEFRVHSKNPVGADSIKKYMENLLKHIGRQDM
jgi:hypothetical protein